MGRMYSICFFLSILFHVCFWLVSLCCVFSMKVCVYLYVYIFVLFRLCMCVCVVFLCISMLCVYFILVRHPFNTAPISRECMLIVV